MALSFSSPRSCDLAAFRSTTLAPESTEEDEIVEAVRCRGRLRLPSFPTSPPLLELTRDRLLLLPLPPSLLLDPPSRLLSDGGETSVTSCGCDSNWEAEAELELRRLGLRLPLALSTGVASLGGSAVASKASSTIRRRRLLRAPPPPLPELLDDEPFAPLPLLPLLLELRRLGLPLLRFDEEDETPSPLLLPLLRLRLPLPSLPLDRRDDDEEEEEEAAPLSARSRRPLPLLLLELP